MADYEVGVVLPPDIVTVEVGIEGLQGEPGVVAADAPITYDPDSQTVGIDPSGFVVSVNGTAGTVLLDATDVGAYPDTNPSNFVDAAGAAAAAPVQSVNSLAGTVVLTTTNIAEGTANLYNRVPTGGTTDQVLIKSSGTAYDVAWSSAPAAPRLTSFRVGEYLRPAVLSASGASSYADGTELAFPIYIPAGAGIDRIAATVVTTAGSSGSVLRFGLRADDNNGFPGTLIVDGGTADSTTTGNKEVTVDVSAATVGNSIIWLCIVPQGAPATSPTLRRFTDGQGFGRYGTLQGVSAAHPDQQVYAGASRTGQTGALSTDLTGWGAARSFPTLSVRLK